jgi:hypothetical protein
VARSRWIYINGEAIPADDYEALARARGHAEEGRRLVIAPDLPDFQSPIDGKWYSGRAGMREHCAKHNVVPTADLAGLPPKRTFQTPTFTKEQARERTMEIARIVDSKWRN